MSFCIFNQQRHQADVTQNTATSPMLQRYMPFKMTLARNSTLTLLLCTLFACNQTSKQSDNSKKIDTIVNSNILATLPTKQKDSTVNNNDIEEKIIDTIFKLTEVKERAKYIDQQTKGKRHLKVWVEDTPKLPDQKYFWIKVGEDNGTNLVTHFNFYVYPGSMRIMYYDIQADSAITLDNWRKLNGM
jgi:hypothetical protein